jgi:hypothetical protein
MPDENANPPAVADATDEGAGDGHAAEPAEEHAGGIHGPDRVYFLIADATEGPTAPVDPDVATRRADRAMERLLQLGRKEAESSSAAPATRTRRRR